MRANVQWLPKRRHGSIIVQSTRPCLPCVKQLMTVFCVHSQIDQPRSGQVVWSVKAGGMNRPSHTKSHPAGSLSSSQPKRAGVLDQLSSLRPHWWLLGYAAHWIVQKCLQIKSATWEVQIRPLPILLSASLCFAIPICRRTICISK